MKMIKNDEDMDIKVEMDHNERITRTIDRERFYQHLHKSKLSWNAYFYKKNGMYKKINNMTNIII
jgi:hypothetical protein